MYSLVFLKENGWDKESALKESCEQGLNTLTTVEDDRLIICITKEKEDETDSDVIMLSESVYCVCKLSEEVKAKLEDKDLDRVKEEVNDLVL